MDICGVCGDNAEHCACAEICVECGDQATECCCEGGPYL